MAKLYDTMMSPEVEGVMDKVGSKFGLCTLAATRAREAGWPVLPTYGLTDERPKRLSTPVW